MGKKSASKKAKSVSASAAAFAQLLNSHYADGAGVFPLTNFSLFLGAGFSKSWSATYPTGPQLFQIADDDRDDLAFVERAAALSGVPRIGDLTMEHIKQIIYTLDMNAKYPSIRSRYVDEQNIRLVKAQLSAFIFKRFRDLVGADWYWFDPIAKKFAVPPLTAGQSSIVELFTRMFRLIDGSNGFMEGARLNFLTTNYDFLVEVATDLATDVDDSAFLYLYRGVTPRNVCGEENPVTAHQHDLVFNLLKINGGFEVFRSGEDYHFDYRDPKDEEKYKTQPPTLILPSREQDYSGAYFEAVFPKAVRLLAESKALVLVGYSLPEEDSLLRFLIRHFCEDAADASDKVVFYVDLASEPDQMKRIESVFPFAGKGLNVITHSGSFADWAADVVSLLKV